MKESIDFRIDDRDASRYLPADLGVRVGTCVRKIVLTSDDPWVKRLAQLDAELRLQGISLIPSCWYCRKYSKTELDAAQLIQLVPTRWFEPCGEECGTVYDDSVACPECGAGARVVSPLRLRASSIPSKSDVAMSIADELVFSDAFAAALRSCGLPESHLERVDFGRSQRSQRNWYRPTLDVPTLDVIHPTTAGENPIRGINPPFGRCPRGDTLGLNLLSELNVRHPNSALQPLYRTKQYFGHRMGLLRPSQKWMLSQPAWRAVHQASLKGFKGEVVCCRTLP